MTQSDSFAAFFTRLRAGEKDAAHEVWQRFTQRLVGLARSQLDSWLRSKLDPEDVVQSVYRSFFTRCQDGQFDLGSWNELWSLLTVITVRKCRNRVEYYRGQSRDATREVSLAASDEAASDCIQAIDREPTPLEAVLLTETVEQLLRGLDAKDCQVIELSLQGYTVPEISARLGRAERTVRWLRARIKKRLQRLQTNGNQ